MYKAVLRISVTNQITRWQTRCITSICGLQTHHFSSCHLLAWNLLRGGEDFAGTAHAVHWTRCEGLGSDPVNGLLSQKIVQPPPFSSRGKRWRSFSASGKKETVERRLLQNMNYFYKIKCLTARSWTNMKTKTLPIIIIVWVPANPDESCV